MKKALIIGGLVLSMVGGATTQTFAAVKQVKQVQQHDVTMQYKVQGKQKDGEYYGVAKDGTGITFNKKDVKQKFRNGSLIKVTFTQKQWKSEEGYKSIVVVKY